MIIRLLGLGVLLMAQASYGAAPSMRSAFCSRLEDRNPDFEKLRERVGKTSAALGFRLSTNVKTKSVNRISSPWSLYAVLAQLLPGAKGETEKELSTLLFGAKTAEAPKAEGETKEPPAAEAVAENPLDDVSDTMALIGCPQPESSSMALVANRIFVDKKAQVLPDYTKSLERNFDTTTGRVDFARDQKGAARDINAWVSKQTMKKITQLVSAGNLSRDTKIVLANTLYLKAPWATKFNKKQTTPGEFRLSKRNKIQLPMMRLKGTAQEFSYAKVGGIEALRTNFADGRATFLVILPEKMDGNRELEKQLGEGKLAEIESKLAPQTVNFVLPRFKISADYELVKPLEKIGLKAPFSADKADFSGIDGGTNKLYVGAILQKVTVEVDERGFEGAAATAAMMRVGGAPSKPEKPVDFIVDRPFLFVVQNSATGAVLFQGAVADPSVRD